MGFFDRFRKFNSPKVEERARPLRKRAKPEAKSVGGAAPGSSAPKPEPVQKPVREEEDTGRAYEILLKPVVTEKATNLASENKYVFEVSPRANKIEIKKAVKNVYGVEPLRVNIIKVSGKEIRSGRISGRTKDWKKAIVTLKPGEQIEIYEGV